MAAFIDVRVDLQRVAAPWVLRNADQRTAGIHVGDDPIAVESLVGQDRIEADPVDQGGHADRIEAMARQQNETNKVAQSIRQGQDLGGPAAL